jgi:hypothetical protein
MGFIRDLLFGEREPRVDDFRVRPRRNKPIYCTLCGRYISDVYLYDGAYYGRHCLGGLLKTEWLDREVERRKVQIQMDRERRLEQVEVGRCTKCGESLGPTLYDAVTHVCDESDT